MKKFVLVLMVLIFLTGCTPIKQIVFHTQNGDYKISAEIADTPEEWERGFMFREKLDVDTGMLFIYPNEAARSFWMKNTLIPLDIIFVDGAGRIINIAKNVQPCKVDPCENYKSAEPAKYVVEIAGGESAKYGIVSGDYFELK